MRKERIDAENRRMEKEHDLYKQLRMEDEEEDTLSAISSIPWEERDIRPDVLRLLKEPWNHMQPRQREAISVHLVVRLKVLALSLFPGLQSLYADDISSLNHQMEEESLMRGTDGTSLFGRASLLSKWTSGKRDSRGSDSVDSRGTGSEEIPGDDHWGLREPSVRKTYAEYLAESGRDSILDENGSEYKSEDERCEFILMVAYQPEYKDLVIDVGAPEYRLKYKERAMPIVLEAEDALRTRYAMDQSKKSAKTREEYAKAVAERK